MKFAVYLGGNTPEWGDKARRLIEQYTEYQPLDAVTYDDTDIYNVSRYLLGQSDAMLLDGRSPSWSGAIELAWAIEAMKPVVIWGITRSQAPAFLRRQATIFEERLEDAVLRVAELSLD